MRAGERSRRTVLGGWVAPSGRSSIACPVDADRSNGIALTQLAQLGGGFANFAGNAPSQLNGLAAISGRFARVVATKAIPFCSWI
jgi:hypothetical protein